MSNYLRFLKIVRFSLTLYGVLTVGVFILFLHFSPDQEEGTTMVTWLKNAAPDRAVSSMAEPSVNMV